MTKTKQLRLLKRLLAKGTPTDQVVAITRLTNKEIEHERKRMERHKESESSFKNRSGF